MRRQFSALWRILALCLAASWLAVSSAAESSSTVHVVTVGANGGIVFSPNVTTANPGDIVRYDTFPLVCSIVPNKSNSFQFWPTNHSVVRGEYVDSGNCGEGVECNPCIPQNLIEPEAPAFFYSKNFLTQSIPDSGNLVVSEPLH
jgi:hypothetical protein